MSFRVLLLGIITSIVLAACGVQDAPGEQSLAQTTAPDDPYPIATQPVSSPTLQQTPEPTTLPPPPATEPPPAPKPAPPLVVQQTGHYTMTTATMPSQLVAWSPDEQYLLMTNSIQPPWLGNLALGRAFLLDLQTGTSSTSIDSIIVGYNVGSYVYPYQEPEWLASGIRLSRPNKDGSPELVELNPHTSEHAEQVLALGTGTFHSDPNGDVLALTDTTLHQPNRAAQTVSLPTDPQVAWMTHFSDDLLVYVPNTTTIKLRTLTTGAEQTWTLDQLPIAETERADAHIVNIALAPNSQFLAISVAYRNAYNADVWMLHLADHTMHLVDTIPHSFGTLLEWAPDTSLIAFNGALNGRTQGWKLYNPLLKRIEYSASNPAIAFVWNTTSTHLAILTPNQENISIYEVTRE